MQLVIDTGGVDLGGRGIVYMRTSAYRPKEVPHPRLISNLVFALERATRNEGTILAMIPMASCNAH
jgi:hypothetical protein